jgi:ABC-type Fe3+-hydroxamate transport system substrate-binding protein
VLPRSFGVVLLVLLAAACGGGTQHSGQADSTYIPPQTNAPKRIVSLSPTATEMLFAIGAGDQVVAVDDQSNYPADAPQTKLSGYEPNVEAIAEYEPDLVVSSGDPGDLVDGLEKLKIDVLIQEAPKNLDGAYSEIEELGQVTGHDQEATSVIGRMRSQIATLVSQASTASGLAVYHELGPDYYSAKSSTFIGSIYEELGAENIADGAGEKAPDYPQLSAEYIVKSDPDVIVLSDTKCCGQNFAKVAARPGWKKIDAVEDGDVVEVDDDIASRWGPRIVDFVRVVAEAMAAAK